MDNYQPNSKKAKAEQEVREKRADKVVKGSVKTKKKSGISKLSDVFISEDVGDIKSYVIMDVLIPAIKRTVSDIVTDSIEMLLGTGREKRSGHRADYVSYSSYSSKNRDRGRDRDSVSRRKFECDDIIFETRGDAELVIDQMMEVADNYDFVSVADLYDMAGMTEPYTSNKYGWSKNAIRRADVVRVREGYIIKLPKPSLID